ncbi:metallophosphoesterase [Moorena producens JHB]|uniref:Metallophosphoesterase n=1 Tax=Moorena producens (strain JHB) TaxID=1454205 RepID=A0A1D9G1H4_MOOP1|nr:metallophosphoesterase [Moorena producens]AOY81482.2 metallophosphoesterase [Moorena producens JHB]
MSYSTELNQTSDHREVIFRWLHLTDLHLGMDGLENLWPNVEEIFFNDLEYLCEQVGPLDLVMFTGDITQGGSESEFQQVDKLLTSKHSAISQRPLATLSAKPTLREREQLSAKDLWPLGIAHAT